MKKHVVLTSVASLLTLASVAVLPAFAQDTGGMRRMENPSMSGQTSEGSSRQRGQEMRWGKGEQRDHNTYGYGSSGSRYGYGYGSSDKGEQRDHNTYRWGKGEQRDHNNYRYGSSGSGYGYDRSGKGNYGYSSGYGYGSPRMSR